MFASLLQELKFALRSLARTPWFTATSVLMLAAGLGLAMYMFGAINGFVLKPLPFMQADRLMFVGYEERNDPGDEDEMPLHDFVEIRAAQTQFEDLAGFYEGTINLSDGERPERYDGVFATASLFGELGMKPHLGRLLNEADNVPGAAPAAVISHTLWVNRFNGDPGVIGRGVRLNGKPGTIVGVMPPRFRFPRKHDVWLALPLDVSAERGRAMRLEAFGRLRAGVTPAAAQAALQAQLERINLAHPDITVADRALVKPYGDMLISDQTRSILYTMFAAVLLVLLIACANVANLMVARGAARQRELAIRGALGAGGRRLVLQVVAESLLIAVAASGLGMIGAILGGELTMHAIMSSEDPPVYWVDFSLDGAGVMFSIAIAIVSALAAALLPAIEAARTPAGQAMRVGGGGSIGRGARLGKILVVLEVAVCMGLLVGAGLTVRSVIKMQTHDLGLDPSSILSGRVALFESAYPGAPERLRFVENLQRRLEEIPGVESATLASSLPMMDLGMYYYQVEGRDTPVDNNYPAAWATWVTPSYFDTFRFQPLSGRVFTAQDGPDSVPVVMVSASFAREAWPDGNALGQRIQVNPTRPESAWATVVGVVPDTVQGQFDDGNSPAAVFLPMAQGPVGFMSFALRTNGDPYALSDAVRAAVQSVDADLPVYWLRSVEDWLDIAMWDGRLLMRLFGTFGLFALLLAMSGIYAVLAYAVGQRTREIGVRRALGARDEGILRMVLGQGGRQLLLGLVIGLVLALMFGRLLANLLFELPSFDPVTFGGVAIVLALVSVAAGWIPARRALRVEPMVALRYE
jgi:putative ABC transport system permease protein